VIGLGGLSLHLQPLAQLGVLLRDPRAAPRSSPASRSRRSCSRFLRWARTGALRPVEEAIAANLDALFPATEVVDHGYFRVTRDADFTSPTRPTTCCRPVQDELPPPPLRRGRAARGRAGMNPKLREPADRRAAARRPRGLRRRRADRPRRPRRRSPTSRATPSCATSPGRRSPSRACRARTRSRSTSSPRSARATSSSTIPTTPSPARSSASSSRRSPTPTCWRSSRRCTGPATTRRWCRR
jgi:hypothetical protein